MQSERCYGCFQPAKVKCSRCLGAPLPDGTTHTQWYCDKWCQKADWPLHKKRCHDLRDAKNKVEEEKKAALIHQYAVRSGILLQKVFYTFIEKLWTIDVKDVKVIRDGDVVKKIEIRAAKVPEDVKEKTICKRRGGKFLVEFPADKVKEEDVKNILLADRNSGLAVALMGPMIRLLFQDIVKDVDTDIKETHIQVKDGVNHVVSQKGFDGNPLNKPLQLYGSVPDHAVFEIKLKTGEMVGLDVTGAEYGYLQRPLFPWTEMEDRYGNSILRRVELGHCSKGLIKNMRKQNKLTMLTVHCAALNQVIARFVLQGLIDKNQIQDYVAIKDESVFEKKMKGLIGAAEMALLDTTTELENRPWNFGAMCVDVEKWNEAGTNT